MTNIGVDGKNLHRKAISFIIPPHPLFYLLHQLTLLLDEQLLTNHIDFLRLDVLFKNTASSLTPLLLLVKITTCTF